jgi:haloacetate dehalogenase
VRATSQRTLTHLACLDVLPTLDMWDALHGRSAAVGFHLYLMAQPPGLPEQLIAASPDAFFGHFLDLWAADSEAIPADVRAAYLDACRAAVPSIVADYRASAFIAVEHDSADRDAGRVLPMPVTVLQQDWGAALGFDAADPWRPRGPEPAPPNRRLRPFHGRGGARRHQPDAAQSPGALSRRRRC